MDYAVIRLESMNIFYWTVWFAGKRKAKFASQARAIAFCERLCTDGQLFGLHDRYSLTRYRLRAPRKALVLGLARSLCTWAHR
jgi:hypothetical protein